MNYRDEIKYIINKNNFHLLNLNLNSILKKDFNCKDKYYTISSLYFDDYKKTSYNQVVNGISERWKYRIRFYNNDDSMIKLEKKYKCNNKTLKSSVVISRDMFDSIVKRQIKIKSNNNKLLNEFIIKINSEFLRPIIFIEYKRIPYVYKSGNVRVTLDYDIGYTRCFDNLFGLKRLKYLSDYILEVKYNNFLPDFIRVGLALNSLEQTSFSKFKNCIERSKIC